LFRDALLKDLSHVADLVGLCDVNKGRIRLAVARAARLGAKVPGYHADEFDRMLAETKPDWVIVTTTKDCDHYFYICRAMERGCDVITEKPMTTDEHKCRRIIATQKETGRRCVVTFNYRYSPPRTQVKELLMSGLIGEVLSVDFHWMLDIWHGADYFRRWHREKKNSGGLMVHKATHHFDLVNWWLPTVPETVHAAGQRSFYIPATAAELGLVRRGERCHDCTEALRCPFHLDLESNNNLREMYLQCEHYDGYYRDRCVFSEHMDIEDSASVIVQYRNRTNLSCSLNAFQPWEGYVICFNGKRGRLKHKCEETVYVNADGSVPHRLKAEGTWIRIYPHREPAYEGAGLEGRGRPWRGRSRDVTVHF